MAANEYRMLSARFGRKDGHKLAVYEAEGGYRALRKVLGGMSPAEVRDQVKEAGLRGRGGAGFPTGVKWGFVPAARRGGLLLRQRRRVRARAPSRTAT